jgi:hypothetical protein
MIAAAHATLVAFTPFLIPAWATAALIAGCRSARMWAARTARRNRL